MSEVIIIKVRSYKCLRPPTDKVIETYKAIENVWVLYTFDVI